MKNTPWNDPAKHNPMLPGALCALTPPPTGKLEQPFLPPAPDSKVAASGKPNWSKTEDTLLKVSLPLVQSVNPAELSHPQENLLHDRLLREASRVSFNGTEVPALGGIPLLARLGQGGMGAVYFGIHPRLQTEVAVKVLPPDLAERQPDLVDRFLLEAQMAARIKSLHLVGVVDVNRENGIDYLVMEFVVGTTAEGLLSESLKRSGQGLAEEQALRICHAASLGLADAHAAGIVHRDIKPANILIPRGKGALAPRCEQAKLADLGIARLEGQVQPLTEASTSMGTFGYMSPEQARDAHCAGKASDVFSLGATLYALLAARTPFWRRTLAESLRATLDCEFQPLSGLRAGLQPATEALVARCLARDPAERFVDGAALAEALEACLPARPASRYSGATAIRRGPSIPPPPPASGAGTGATEAQAEARAPIHVLVIDDDSVSRIMLKRYLALAPWPTEVFLAGSAEEAQAHIEGLTPDLIVTDVCMPGVDGYEMIEWIRSQKNLGLTPIVVSSSIPEGVGKQRSLMVGADAYLQKPVTLEALKRVLARMVARIRPGA